MRALPTETVTADIDRVTRWSKLNTEWQSVSVDTLLAQVEHDAGYVLRSVTAAISRTCRYRTLRAGLGGVRL